MDDELLLRSGVSVKAAVDSLSSLIAAIRNVAGAGGGSFGKMWNDYLTWVEAAETHLSNLFRSRGVWQELHNDRYWHIRGMRTGAPTRPEAAIRSEADWQTRRLQEIVDEFIRIERDFASVHARGMAVVPDTSFFMNYKRFFDEIDWSKELGASSVRLVIPLLVIDELDDLSFRRKDSSERARKVIRALRRLRGNRPPGEPVPMRRNVELQVMVDRPGHRRRSNNDDEILARVEYLAAYIGPERVRVLAMDYGMQLRASSRDLQSVQLPEEEGREAVTPHD
jgi:hypothetical protein